MEFRPGGTVGPCRPARSGALLGSDAATDPRTATPGVQAPLSALRRGSIFRRVLTYKEYEVCPRCEFRYDPRGESVAFMYFSTAFLTGLLVIAMLLTRPQNLVVGRIFVVAAALGLYLVTMPLRKAIAIAINYLHAGEEGR